MQAPAIGADVTDIMPDVGEDVTALMGGTVDNAAATPTASGEANAARGVFGTPRPGESDVDYAVRVGEETWGTPTLPGINMVGRADPAAKGVINLAKKLYTSVFKPKDTTIQRFPSVVDDLLNQDNCPLVANPEQADWEKDGIGNVCPPDDDNDGVCDPGFSDPSCSGSDSCQYAPYNDSDGDNLCGDADNCPATYNPNQEDTYPPGGNGIGNACECEGNFNCFEDVDVDGSDASTFKTDFGRSPYLNPCNAGDPCNGNFNSDQDVDGGDAALFKTDFGRSGFVNPCPTCTQGNSGASKREGCRFKSRSQKSGVRME